MSSTLFFADFIDFIYFFDLCQKGRKKNPEFIEKIQGFKKFLCTTHKLLFFSVFFFQAFLGRDPGVSAGQGIFASAVILIVQSIGDAHGFS